MTEVSVTQRLRELAQAVLRPTGPRRLPSRRSQVFDAVLALVITVAAVNYVIDRLYTPAVAVPIGYPTGSGDLFALLALAIVGSGSLALRRRYPLAVLLVVMGVTMLTPDDAARLSFYPGVIAAYTAAAHSPYRVPTVAALLGCVVLVTTVRDDVAPTVPTQYAPLLISVPVVVAAIGLRSWKTRADETRTRLDALERDQSQALRRAVEEERARIARELHDVVTHNVSVMVIQAGAARKVMEVAPDQAREALLAVEAGGRAAMGELRHVMGLLTTGEDPLGAEIALTPQPGPDQLPALIERVRNAGLPVELTVLGKPRPMPAGIGLAAYRVVQEALTNTVKHTVGTAAAVTVEYAPDALTVVVTDAGGRPAAAATGSRRGLIGLRERLALYGGTLKTGPRPLGGYRVHAVIPLENP